MLLTSAIFFVCLRYAVELIAWKKLLDFTDSHVQSNLPWPVTWFLIISSEMYPTLCQFISMYLCHKYNWQFFFTGNMNARDDSSTVAGSVMFSAMRRNFANAGLESELLQTMSDS